MSAEEYLEQTGVSAALEGALGLAAELRPVDPLQFLADIPNPRPRQTVSGGGRLSSCGKRLGLGQACGSGQVSYPASPSSFPSSASPARSTRSFPPALTLTLSPGRLPELCVPVYRLLCSRTGRASPSWEDVRRLLEVLCHAAGVEPDSTAAAISALERQGRDEAGSTGGGTGPLTGG
ncbi:unnamed protein product, partial [Discosporangium mesarthrocarpum]